MPELPEVETVCRSLRPHLTGHCFTKIEVRRDKSFPLPERREKILNVKILELRRRAKLIDLVLENDWHVLTHLKMTGQLLVKSKDQLAGGGHPTSDVLQQLPGNHTRIIYTLDDGGQLFFNDLRVFGWMKVLTAAETQKEFANYGPDANEELDWRDLKREFGRRRQKIKQVLMDNQVLAGIGNIYASEILFAGGVDPRRPANSLSDEEIEKLTKEMKRILDAAIELRGTTFDGRYVDAAGKAGNYVEKLQVYGREGEKCYRCGATLQNVKIGGRASCFCESCQR